LPIVTLAVVAAGTAIARRVTQGTLEWVAREGDRIAEEDRTLSPAQRLLVAVLALLAVFLVGTAGYMLLEQDVHPTFGEAAYMTVITVSTVGFHEVWPLSPTTRLWTIGVIVFGIATVSYAFTSLVALFVSGELRSQRERRKMTHTLDQLRDHVILCGYGRTGAMVVEELYRQHKQLVVIDHNADHEPRLKQEGIPHIIGDATSEETLLQAGLMRADALVAMLANDADNVYVTLTANALKPEIRVIARAEHPTTEPKLRRAGATRVVCPHIIGARKMAALLTRPNVVDFVETVSEGVELEMDEHLVTEASAICGKTLRESRVRDISGGSVVAIRRSDGQTLYNPEPNSVIERGDTLVVVGPSGISGKLEKLGEQVS